MPAARPCPDDGQPGRLRTRLARGSLAVNALLLALLLWPAAQRSTSATINDSAQPDAAGSGTTSSSQPFPPVAGRTTATPRRKSTWSQLESADFREFAANLRRAGCPEETLCDVLRPAIERSFTDRRGRLGQSGGFWATGAARRSLRAQAEAAEADLNDEQDRLLGELACSIDPFEKENDFQGRLLIELVTGFLDRSAQRGLLQVMLDSDRIRERWAQRTRGVLLPEDIAALERERDGLRRRLDALVSPAQREEVELRVRHLTKNENEMFGDRGRLLRLQLTPAELREFNRITSGTEVDPLTESLDLHQFLGESSPRLTAADAEAQLRELLGDERFAHHRQDNDNTYQHAQQMAEQHRLPAEVAGQVFQTMEQFRAELAPLRAAWADDRGLTRQALLEQRAQVRSRLDVLLVGVPEPGRREALNRWVDQAIQELWRKP